MKYFYHVKSNQHFVVPNVYSNKKILPEVNSGPLGEHPGWQTNKKSRFINVEVTLTVSMGLGTMKIKFYKTEPEMTMSQQFFPRSDRNSLKCPQVKSCFN
jgi:hypothetical protein